MRNVRSAAVYLDYERIKNRTPRELEAENRWWDSLSEEQKRAHLDRWRKEDNERETMRVIVGLIILVAFVLVPGILGCIELGKIVFR
jgi:hypothetical protein